MLRDEDLTLKHLTRGTRVLTYHALYFRMRKSLRLGFDAHDNICHGLSFGLGYDLGECRLNLSVERLLERISSGQ